MSQDYIPLATVTLASSASSVTFSNIPATYRDLVLLHSSQNSTQAANTWFRYNGDTGSNYNGVVMSSQGGNITSSSYSNNGVGFVGSTENGAIGNLTVNIFDYAQTDKHKTAVSRNSVSPNNVSSRVLRWASTSAITSINIQTDGGTWAAGATFSLYGIVA